MTISFLMKRMFLLEDFHFADRQIFTEAEMLHYLTEWFFCGVEVADMPRPVMDLDDLIRMVNEDWCRFEVMITEL